MGKYVKPEGTFQLFLDESAPGEKFRGEPPLVSSDETREFCPKCFKEINAAEDTGYGLAFGGMGMYATCSNGDCDWFYKIMDADEEPSHDQAQ